MNDSLLSQWLNQKLKLSTAVYNSNTCSIQCSNCDSSHLLRVKIAKQRQLIKTFHKEQQLRPTVGTVGCTNLLIVTENK